MNKDIMLGILIGFILTIILAGVGGFFVYQKFTTFSSGVSQSVNGPSSVTNGNCAPATGETAFSGKVASFSPPGHPDYKQYTLQSANGTTYYLNTTNPVQASSLENKMGKDIQVNGTLVRPNEPRSTDVNVTTICP